MRSLIYREKIQEYQASKNFSPFLYKKACTSISDIENEKLTIICVIQSKKDHLLFTSMQFCFIMLTLKSDELVEFCFSQSFLMDPAGR